jgi:phage head maturation protease
MDNGVETRRITVNEFELRDATEGDGMTFVGYGAVFNSDSEPLPFTERIAPGAFSRSLRSRNEIKMFVHHQHTAHSRLSPQRGP